MSSRLQAGFTLTELLAVLGIVAILAVLALPAFTELLDRQRLSGTAESLYGEVQFARSEAVRRNRKVFLSFGTGANSCVTIATAEDCLCDGCADTDTLIRQLPPARFAQDHPNITITALTGVTAGFGISPRQGATDADVDVGITLKSTSTAHELRVIVGVLGIPRICSPSGAATGYPSC